MWLAADFLPIWQVSGVEEERGKGERGEERGRLVVEFPDLRGFVNLGGLNAGPYTTSEV
jgi:hypothetical protein